MSQKGSTSPGPWNTENYDGREQGQGQDKDTDKDKDKVKDKDKDLMASASVLAGIPSRLLLDRFISLSRVPSSMTPKRALSCAGSR